jgi:UPF0716 protein FxsA
MGLLLLIAFIATPIIEIAIFIEAGERFGLWPTLGAVVLTAVIGTGLLRWQGFTTWRRAAESLQRGVFPVNEVFAGLCLIAAGALLLTPGFLTDAIGFALFVPAVRQVIAHLIKRAIERGDGPNVWVNGQPMGPRDTVIDGEYETQEKPAPPEIELPPGPPNPNSPWNKNP